MAVLGILSQRWRLVSGPVIGKTENIETLISACCVLHNYLCITNDPVYLPPGSVDAITGANDGTPGHWRGNDDNWHQAPRTNSRNSTAEAARMRETLTDYFYNEGAVPWQNEYITRRSNRR